MTTPTAPPVWRPFIDAVTAIGLSRSVLESEITAGRIPLRLVRHGARQARFVNGNDLEAYLAHARQPISVGAK